MHHRREATQIQRDDWGGMGTNVASQLTDIASSKRTGQVSFNVSVAATSQILVALNSAWEIVDTFYMWDFRSIRDKAEAAIWTCQLDSICGTNFCPSNNFVEGY